jgi:hypothetical protein
MTSPMKAVTAACGCTYVCAALSSDRMSRLIGAAAPTFRSDHVCQTELSLPAND